MTGKELRSFRRKIGMIFQHFNLLSSRTVYENIAYPLEVQGYSEQEIHKRVEVMLHLVDLEAKRNVYPAKLSGGQKQRVGIARALAPHPDVLLCDEATSALDPKTTHDILSLLRRLNEELNLTIVLITHEMDVVKRVCNKVAVVDRGKIIESGSLVEIFADPKHPITKQFIQHTTHELPKSLFKRASEHGTLLRLTYKGNETDKPLISQMIRAHNVDVNILHGWIESLSGVLVGNLILDVTGSSESVQDALAFLAKHQVHYEVL